MLALRTQLDLLSHFLAASASREPAASVHELPLGVRTHLPPPRPLSVRPAVSLMHAALTHVPHRPASRFPTHTYLSAVREGKHSHVRYKFIFLFIRLVSCFALLQDSLSASI